MTLGFKREPCPPPKKNGHFFPNKGLKMQILDQRQCFLGSRGQFKAHPPYFAGPEVTKSCVAAYGSRKLGVSPPPPENGHSLPKKGLQMPISGQNQCLPSSGGQFKPLLPISQVLDPKRHVLQHMRARKCVFQPRPKKWPFCPQMAEKCHFWAKNSVFRARVVSSRPPHPSFAGAQLTKKCVAAYGSQKMGVSEPPPPKKRPFCAEKKG